MHEVATWPR